MIRLIARLEKTKVFWTLLWISIGFFFLRLPSLFEPNWYGDEGVYQVIGRALNNGSMLYSQIWDNKPPLLYLTYALFHGDQFSVRLASLLTGIAATCLFYAITQNLFSKSKISTIATITFAVLFGIPLIEGNIANAENFMLLPIIAAAFLIYSTTDTKYKILNTKYSLSVAGILLGIAFLFKIVAIFDFAALLVFLLILSLPEKNIIKMKTIKDLFFTLTKPLLVFILSFLVPIVITVLYFIFTNTFSDFIGATFFGNIGYVNYGNKLLFAQGLLVIKLLLLAGSVALVVMKRKQLGKTGIFTFIWIAFSLFNAFFSQRPYTHYVLVMLPSFCLLLALILNEQKIKTKQIFIFIFLAVLLLLSVCFKIYSLKKTVLYYQNAVLYITGKKDTKSYQAFFDGKTPRDYAIASFIKMNTKPNDRIFIWGDSPQIYALSNTLPINKYTVSYHMRQSKEGMLATQKAIHTVKPKYVIMLFESPSLPFRLNNYTSRFTLTSAAIYERSL